MIQSKLFHLCLRESQITASYCAKRNMHGSYFEGVGSKACLFNWILVLGMIMQTAQSLYQVEVNMTTYKLNPSNQKSPTAQFHVTALSRYRKGRKRIPPTGCQNTTSDPDSSCAPTPVGPNNKSQFHYFRKMRKTLRL